MMKALKTIHKKLNELKNIKIDKYYIPSLWMFPEEKPSQINVNPVDFFTTSISKIISKEKVEVENNKNKLITYNLFVRFATAFDHNQDGSITAEVTGFRETGTFLKAIAMLNYLKYLGINTVYMLPITSIGIDRKKGNLGSPYAIRNPYKIDDNLSEDILGIDTETQFRAFVKACHHLGIKVVCEFVFRTGSVDSDLAITQPEWFYWLKQEIEDRPAGSKDEKLYGPPIFDNEELALIKQKVESNNFSKLPEPHKNYLDMFTDTPKKVINSNNRIIGERNGKMSRIPGAFADWPPDDSQPVWSDVTYLKLFDNKNFNYIAYNTVRMYDDELNNQSNKIAPLWDFISGIIPHYIKSFDIDGVMIDMGHALPSELRAEISERARNAKEDFIFWEENFVMNENSVKEGYDAVLGYLPFDAHNPYNMRDLIRYISSGNCPINFFATPESHNTPRAASRFSDGRFNRAAYLVAAFLQAMPFIHNGFELCETNPVNTGLGFQAEDYERYPAEKLPLFSVAQLDWQRKDTIIKFIKQVNDIRKIYSPDEGIRARNIHLISADSEEVVAFVVRNKVRQSELLIAANLSDKKINSTLDILSQVNQVKDLINNKFINFKNNELFLEFDEFDVYAIELIF